MTTTTVKSLAVFLLFGYCVPALSGDAPFEPPHPVLGLKGHADEALLKQFTDAEWLMLVPTQSPRKAAGFARLGEKNTPLSEWVWDSRAPNQVTCKATGEIYPGPAFTTKQIKIEVLSGKLIEIPYVEGTKKGDNAFAQAYVDYQKFLFLERQLSRLGAAYAGTHDERYSRVAALILDKWANFIPDYFIGQGNAGLPPITPEQAEKALWFCCRVSTYNAMAHEWPHNALAAFDCIYDSAGLKELTVLRKYDVREHIARDLFGNIGDVFLKRIKPEWAIRTNLSLPYMVLADAATILNRPDYIEYLNRYLEDTITENFKRDGMFPESFTYHRGYAGVNEGVVKNVMRYFELRPASTESLRATKAACDDRAAFLHRASTAHFPVCYPDGLIPPFGDSSAAKDAPRTETRSALLPAYGHAALGRGTGELQTQLNVGWGDYNNHCQDDVLGMTLFAFGTELIANNRYDRGPSRPFNNHTLGHNTVLIDRQSQSRRAANDQFTSGNLTFYDSGDDGIAVVELDGSRAYPELCTRYQRLMILNTVDPRRPYALDFFCVTGGKIHDYVLHGSGTLSQKSKASIPLNPLADSHPLLALGEKWQDPAQGNFPVYGMLLNVREARSPGAWSVDFLGARKGEPLGTRLSMLDDASNQLFVAESPVLGSGQAELAKSANEDAEELIKRVQTIIKPDEVGAYKRFLRPSILVRRESVAAPLKSVFVSLVEPLKGKSAIETFEPLPLKLNNADSIALRIRFTDGRVDTVLVSLDNPSVSGCPGTPQPVELRDGSFALVGRIGVHIHNSDGREEVKSVGASRFQFGKSSLSSTPARITGTITKAERRATGSAADALFTDAEFPEGVNVRNQWMSVSFGIYKTSNGKEQKGISEQFQIERIEKANGGTKIYTKADHTLNIDGINVRETMRPHRTFAGPACFELYLIQPLQQPR